MGDIMDLKPRDICPEARAFYEKCWEHPGACLGKAELSRLEVFLQGWSFGFGGREVPVLLPEGFSEYAAERYGEVRSLSAIGYAAAFGQRGDRSIDEFFRLLNEYLVKLGHEPLREPKNSRDDEVKNGICPIYYPDLKALALSYMNTFNAPPWNDCWTEETAFDRVDGLLCGYGRFGYAAWQEGSLTGSVISEREFYYDGVVCRIIELWTDPAYRGRGIGRRLIEEVRRSAGGNVYLITKKTPETVGFYGKCGFSANGSMCVMQTDNKSR